MSSGVPDIPRVQDARFDMPTYCAPAPAETQQEIVVDHFPFVLGRHPDCDRPLLSRQVSRRHCQFFRRGEGVWVEDLNSYNGTFLNGHEVRRARPLRDGDVITLHPYRFRCHLAANQPVRLVPDGMEDPQRN